MRKALLIILILVLIVGGFPIVANAVSFGIPFGGRILSVTYCTCSIGLLLTIGPPRSGTFIFQAGISTLYKWYKVYTSGAYALGLATGSSTCLIYSGTTCITVGSGPIIRMIGTSL